MTSAELKHRAKLQEWAARIQDCHSSGLSVRAGHWLLWQAAKRKSLQILKGSLFRFFYGCTLRKARKKDAIRESILKEKIQEIYSQNRR